MEDEGEKEELAEVGVRKEGNKENENTGNLNWEGPSRVHEKTMTFVANEKEENQASIRLGPKVKKASNMRSTQSQKPKSKLIGPTRGLVYGPTTEGIDMSASGKRLRVEKESIGRPGGVFTGVSDVEGKERNPDQAEEQRSMQVQIAQMETPPIATSYSCVEQVGEALTGTGA